jgi:aerobic-type carbon monoxide dehydrogenase small subunit (CoxS/CutS family)
MTTRWLREHAELLDEMSLRALLSGNLCRCTGYDGIIAGVERVLGRAEGD